MAKDACTSMFGMNMQFHTDLLQWLLQKGLQISNITYADQYERQKCFQTFVDFLIIILIIF
jgi:hypothetical protein